MLSIRPLSTTREEELCAEMMAASEPWITLGRDYEGSLKILRNPARESYVAYRGEELAGFLILITQGAFVGYIATVCVAPSFRGSGAGTELVRFAEERIFAISPNVFLCVSSFNERAKKLYARLGYKVVGELENYLVAGHSEILMRKTIGPVRDFFENAARRG